MKLQTSRMSTNDRTTILNPTDFVSNFTPVGMRCRVCGKGMVANSKAWRHHMKHACKERGHYKVDTYYDKFDIYLKAQVEKANLKPFHKHLPIKPKTMKKVYCQSCHVSYQGLKKFNNEHNDSKCKDKRPIVKTFIQLTCGHWVIDRRKATMSVNESTTRPITSINQHHSPSIIGKMPSQFLLTSTTTTNLISKLMREDEDVSEYVQIFHSFFLQKFQTSARLHDYINDCLQLSNIEVSGTNSNLKNLLESTKYYYERCDLIINNIPGNVRVKLNKFTYDDNESNHEWLFSSRKSHENACQHICQMFTYMYNKKCKVLWKYISHFSDTNYLVDETYM